MIAERIATREVIVGPPGTGKTTTLVKMVKDLIDGGLPPERIGYFTFSRAAIKEALGRLELGKQPWWSTIHAAGYKLLKEHGLVKAGRFVTRRLATARFPSYSEILFPDDQSGLIDIYSLMKSNQIDSTEIFNRSSSFPEIALEDWLQWVIDYEAWKKREGLVDYSDCIDLALGCPGPDLDCMLIDESQDLGKSEIKLIEHWFTCRQVIVGDDDQTIYRFIGADPNWMIKQAKDWPTTVLEQSRRVPILPFNLAQKIVSKISNRIEKVYRPKPEPGMVRLISIDEIPEIAAPLAKEGKTVAILVRTRWQADRVNQVFADQHVPTNDMSGSRSSMHFKKSRKLFRIWRDLTYPRPKGYGTIRGKDCLLVWRQYDNLEGCCPNTDPYTGDFKMCTRGYPGNQDEGRYLFDIDTEKCPWIKPGLTEAYQKWGAYEDWPLQVMTMHQSKGRQFDCVFLIPDITRRVSEAMDQSQEALDDEHRLFYVAATRTKDRLYTVLPSTKRFYVIP